MGVCTQKSKGLVSLALGPIIFVTLYCFLPQAVFPETAARGAVGTVAWMAFWWVTGPVDYAVTAFLPIAVNALFSMTAMAPIIANYANETIMLLLGASIIVVSWEQTGMDKRIAIGFLSLVGNRLRTQVVVWFLLSAALSAILPNAVVCATVTPIAIAMLKYLGEDNIGESKIGALVLLTIAYAAGVGGLTSPLGGAMNLITVEYLEELTGQEYMYTSWVIRFLPIMIVLIVSNILFLIRNIKRDETLSGTKEYFQQAYRALGPMSREEKWSLALFIVPTVLAFTRQLYQTLLPGLKPAYVFIICAIISFTVRKSDGTRLMEWKRTQGKIIWDLIYIFAGGLAAGTLINNTGAAECIGSLVAGANLTGGYITVLLIVVFTLLLSDVTSNTATAAVALPIVISIAQGIGKNPIPYIYVATIGVNLSYMLPTSIRAIPVGYGLKPHYMLKEGVQLTVIVILLMSIMGHFMLKYWPLFSCV